MQNIEIKARMKDINKLRSKVLDLNPRYIGIDQQTDTYFNTLKGRLKLRESSLSGPYLIPYLRNDQSGPKSSVYQKIHVPNPQDVKYLLCELLGCRVTVIKSREIFLLDNIRIHLDRVDRLGQFVEFEAVMDSNGRDEDAEAKKLTDLMNQLGIEQNDLISVSYENLIQDLDEGEN